jgi:hypothetical protein
VTFWLIVLIFYENGQTLKEKEKYSSKSTPKTGAGTEAKGTDDGNQKGGDFQIPLGVHFYLRC